MTNHEHTDLHDFDDASDQVRRALAGDEDAWTALHRRFDRVVRAIAHRDFGFDDADAADVSQTVWLKVFEHLDRIDEPRALPGWLATTARRVCLTRVRQRSREQCSERLGTAGGTGSDTAGSPRDRSNETPVEDEVVDAMVIETRRGPLREVLADLDAERRLLLELLFEDDGPSYADISATLGRPIGAIGPTRKRLLDRMSRDPRLQAVA